MSKDESIIERLESVGKQNRRMKRIGAALCVIVAALLLTDLVSEAQTTTDSLRIGSVTLQLGMSKDIVVPQLAKEYAVSRWEPLSKPAEAYTEMWTIATKGTGSALIIGSVNFDSSGKLSGGRKEWTPEDRAYSAAEIGRIIYTIISGFEGYGNTRCSISTERFDSPGPGVTEMRESDIICGHKKIEISATRQSATIEGMQITEVLR